MSSRFALLAVVLFAACSRAHDAPPAPTVAASAAATPARGSSPAAPLTCRTLESCTDACGDAACAEACVRRLTAAARPAYDALQACVKPACADGDSAPCRTPAALACKLCVVAHCAAQAAACMKS